MATSNSSSAKNDPSPSVSAESRPVNRDAIARNQDTSLRLRAEQCYADREPENSRCTNALEAQGLLQELEIHQIELEMQNLELQHARDQAEEAREMYRDLYDFAPVGYFTLSEKGEVLMANLTGAILLGLERDTLTGSAFSQWIPPTRRSDFERFLAKVFSGKVPVSIELDIQQAGGKPFIADIEARKGVADHGCRMVMSDVTRRKSEEKAKKLLNISTQSNRKLQAEVLHWREVENTLETTRGGLDGRLEKSDGKQEKILGFSHALLRAQEDERKRISRELHDRIIQAMEAIQYELELLTRE